MRLLYFAWVRQKIGRGEEDFALPTNVRTVGELAHHLRRRGDGYAEVFADMSRLRAAVNREHASLDAKIGADDEIAFFPPVTGG